jgi:2-oxoglutarate ferredoxin oxidoreductase subunit delta
VRDAHRQPIIPKPSDVPQGTVYVLVEECKGCGLCIEFCPREVLVLSPDTNAKGHNYPVVVKEGECANCQMCTLICSEFAIFSTLAPEALEAIEALEAHYDEAMAPA